MKRICFLIPALVFVIIIVTNKNIIAQDVIKSVKIGDQVWTSENLNVEKFRNGDLIPEAKTNQEWMNAASDRKPAWCYFENKTENGVKYGKMYNFWAVYDERGLAPEGWHIPTEAEFKKLIVSAGNDLKALMSELEGGSNKTQFNAVMGGLRFISGAFWYPGNYVMFWGADAEEEKGACRLNLDKAKNILEIKYSTFSYGGYVRCIKD